MEATGRKSEEQVQTHACTLTHIHAVNCALVINEDTTLA